MAYTRSANFDIVKELAAGSIGAGYTAIGTQLYYASRVLILANLTNADVMLSDNGADDKLPLAAGDKFVVDLTANNAANDPWFYPAKRIWHVKRIGTPTTGSVYVISLYGRTD